MGLLLGTFSYSALSTQMKSFNLNLFVSIFSFANQIGLDKGECTYEDLERAKAMVPKSFQRYVERKLF